MPACPDCLLDCRECLCDSIPSVRTRTRILIVRHPIEATRRTNSGRLAARALPDSGLLEPDRGRTFAPGTWLLYPGGEALPPGRPAALVVLDGSWREARRMFLRAPALQKLPRMSLPPPPPTERLRRSKTAENMATLEAIAHAVGALEGSAVAQPLHELYRTFVERATRSARRVGRRPT